MQGHVDQTAECMDIKDAEGSWYFTFRYAFEMCIRDRAMEIEYIRIKRFNLEREKVYATGTDAIHCCLIPVSYTHLTLSGGTDETCGRENVYEGHQCIRAYRSFSRHDSLPHRRFV